MACNLNFNQCFSGPSYPIPIYTCANIFINLFGSPNTVINPTTSAFAFFNSTTPQAVATNGAILLDFVTGSGNDISNGASGITLSPGTYSISFGANGIIPAGGVLSIALRQNGIVNPASVSTSTGVAGSTTNVTNSMIITLTTPTVINLINNLGESEIINSANLTIIKLV